MATNTTKDLQAMLDKTVSVQELARREGVTILSIHQWRRKGLPAIVIKGDRRPTIRFNQKEAKQWITNARRAGVIQ